MAQLYEKLRFAKDNLLSQGKVTQIYTPLYAPPAVTATTIHFSSRFKSLSRMEDDANTLESR